MRRMIDGHVHLRVARLCGRKDSPIEVTLLKNGKLSLTDGRVVQFLPVFFENSCFETETLMETMETYQVEKAVIMQSFAFNMNMEISQAVRKYPDRLRGAMVLDLHSDVEEQVGYYAEKGLSIIKFEMSPVLGYTHPKAFPDMKFDSDTLFAIFAQAQELGLTIAIDTNMVGGKGYQVEALECAIKAFPQLKFVVCHLGFARPEYLLDQNKYRRWEEMVSLARYANVWVDISAFPDLFAAELYPYPSALQLTRNMIEKYSADSFIWGSDIPGTWRNATYPEMVAMFESGLGLTEEELDRIFYKNAQEVYFA